MRASLNNDSIYENDIVADLMRIKLGLKSTVSCPTEQIIPKEEKPEIISKSSFENKIPSPV
jgi:hypothetical protein